MNIPTKINLSDFIHKTASIWSMILFAFVINNNAIRVVLSFRRIDITNILFVAFCIFIMIKNIFEHRKLEIKCEVFLILAITLFYCFVTNKSGGYDSFIKFVTGILVAYFSSMLSDGEIMISLKFSVFLSAVYSAYVIMYKSTIYSSLLVTGIYNYLFVTLPIGLGASIAIVLAFLGSKNKKVQIIYFACSILQLYGLANYSARGSLIFPIVIAAFMILSAYKCDIKKMLISVITLIAFVTIAIFCIKKVANERLIERISVLFHATGTETRIPIYLNYSKYILIKGNIIFGEGFGSSPQILNKCGISNGLYPHNFALQLFGELGVLGLALMIFFTVRILQSNKRWKQTLVDENNSMLPLYFMIVAGLLFYLLTYAKSYSIYDGYQLFIFLSIMLSRKYIGKRIVIKI